MTDSIKEETPKNLDPQEKVMPPDDIRNEPIDVSTDELADNSSNAEQDGLDNSKIKQ